MDCAANGAISGCLAIQHARSAVSARHLSGEVEEASWPTKAPLHARLKGTATASDREGAAFPILTGSYIGYLPDHLAAPWVAAGRLRALSVDDGLYLTPFVIITRRDLRPPRVLEAFMGALYRPK